MKLTILLLTLLQTPGPFFNTDDSPFASGNPIEAILTLIKVFVPVMAAFILFAAVKSFFVGGGQQSGEAAPVSRAAARPEASRPAAVQCGWCGSSFTRNKVTDSGKCPSCGGPLEAAA